MFKRTKDVTKLWLISIPGDVDLWELVSADTIQDLSIFLNIW